MRSGLRVQNPRWGTHRGPSKRKAVLIGAAIGGGIGALWGSHYCAADCGGGRPRGATVFGSLGAGIGAAGGLGVAILAGL